MGNNLPSANRRRLPRWARLGLVVVALLLVAGLALPYFLDVDRYRTFIAASIEEQTGRKATIGVIHARFLPTVGFTVDGVKLSNPPNFPKGDLISVETLKGNLAWGPLSRRQVQVTSIELIKPKLTLLSDAAGQTNYDFSSHGGAPNRSGARGKTTEGSSFSLQEIERVSLTDAEIALGNVIRGRVAPGTSIKGLSAEVRHLTADSAMMKHLEGEADLGGSRIETSALAVPVEVNSGKLKIEQGRATGDFRAQLGKDLEVKGTLKVADLENPVVEFDLSTGQLDLAALGEVFGGPGRSGDDPPAPAAARGKSDLVAKGKISAERLRYGPYTANNGVAEVRIFTDRLEAFPARMDLYGGVLQIAARADRTQTPLRFSANLKLNNIDVAKLVSVDPATKGKITGTGEINLQLVGSAGARLLDTLTGTGDFAFRDGQLPGINLPSALGSIAKFAGGSTSSSTPYKIIQGDLSIAQGRVSSKQIHMDSPIGTVDLRGSFGFDSTLNYDGQATLVPGAGGGTEGLAVGALTGILGGAMGKKVTKASIPFSLQGTFANGKVLPGKALPKFETAAPDSTTTQQKKPSLQDTLKDLFKKP
jgi:uncharacterized protein involved in outer membrane biogenesis